MRFAEALAQRAENRDAAADARLERDVDALARGGFEDLAAVHREQRLVRSDDVLACVDRSEDELLRRPVAADQLDHDLHARVGDQAGGVRSNECRRVDAARARCRGPRCA
jgi:hypothetical protein